MAYEVPPIIEERCAGCGEIIPIDQCRFWKPATKECYHGYCEHLIPKEDKNVGS